MFIVKNRQPGFCVFILFFVIWVCGNTIKFVLGTMNKLAAAYIKCIKVFLATLNLAA